MSELPKKKRKLTKTQKLKLIKEAKPLFEYYFVTSKQIGEFADAALKTANVYSQLAEGLIGPMKTMLEAQKRISTYIYNVAKILTTFNQINFVIPIPRQEMPQVKSIPIYIQPDVSFVPTKNLPSPNRKQSYSLEMVSIKEKGFTLNGQYISGMTTESLTGKLFKLMTRKDMPNGISDRLISETLGIANERYDLIGVVLHDIKRTLRGNKLKLELHRNRGIKEYTVAGITKYIRNPRKKKSANSMAKNN